MSEIGEKYTKENALDEIMTMQNSFQHWIADKRGYVDINSEKVEDQLDLNYMSMYMFGCFIAEADEAIESVQLNGFSDDTKFEIADMTCFMTSAFCYAGVKKFNKTLEEYWAEAQKYEGIDAEQFESNSIEDTLTYIVGKMSTVFGAMYRDIPCKKWKTYKELERNNIDKVTWYCEKILKLFCIFCDISNMTPEDVYSYYMSKNKVNYDRQLDKTKGYLG